MQSTFILTHYLYEIRTDYMEITSYERIKNSIVLDFEEYIEEDGLNVAQVSAKTLEEDWRRVNDSFVYYNFIFCFYCNRELEIQ
jgi:hypothetical protein